MIVGLFLTLGSLMACSGDDPVEPEPLLDAEDVSFHPDLEVDLSRMTRLESGVYYEDLVVPEDPEATEILPLYRIWVTYSGWLSDGTAFAVDQTFFNLQIGAGEVISGWDLGLIGLREGGVRKLVIPPARAYGHTGGAVIPPNTVLVFEVRADQVQPSN